MLRAACRSCPETLSPEKKGTVPVLPVKNLPAYAISRL